jgi:uncharacterized SAM-binding protein YcdF (DUF218 family)
MTYFQPLLSALLVVSLFIGGWCAWRSRSVLPVLGALSLFLVSWPPLAMVILRGLESPYSYHLPSDRGIQAIVVLSSGVSPPFPPRPTAILGFDSYERCVYAAWLHTHCYPVPVLASGGGSRGGEPYAVTMGEALQREGVAKSMIWTEEASRSTYENAEFSARILRARGIHRILLVTEAYHMPRAEACFRKQGFDVVPAACGFRTWNEDVLHEILGMIWYKANARI